MSRRFSRRTGLAYASSALLVAASASRVAAQDASPAATTTIPDLPAGPLGEQIQWFVDLMNGDPAAITGDAIAPHFSENALLVMSADDIAATLAEFATTMAPITVEPATMFTTRDQPPTTARFVIAGKSPADRLGVNINVSSATGLIEGLTFSTAPDTAGATPAAVASPVATIPDLPQGPLGEQIQWLVDLLNGDAADITAEVVEPHMAEVVLDQVPAADLATTLAGVATQAAPVAVEPNTMATTRDMPPSSAQFVLAGRDEIRLLTSLSVDGESGLITGLFFQPAPDPPAAEATPAS